MGVKRKLKYILIFLTIMLLLITGIYIFLFERFAAPVAQELARQYSLTGINASINSAVKRISGERGISAEDLYTPHFNSDGKLTYLEVNSILINELCADTAQSLSEDLNRMSSQKISLPLGVLTGLNIFANSGPGIPLYLTPSGSASADYETSVESAGIGQVNFKVWLVVNTDIGIINPVLVNKRIKVTRKLMLVNTMFSGEVPDAFYGEK